MLELIRKRATRRRGSTGGNTFAGAEAAFRAAKQKTVLAGDRLNPRAQADFLHLLAALRLFQRRLAESLDLQNQALELLGGGKRPLLLVRALIQRAAIIGYDGRPQDTINDLRAALTVTERHDHPFLALTARTNLATSYALAGAFDQAARILPAAAKRSQELGQRTVSLQLRWIEGLVERGRNRYQEATSCLLEARRGFTELNQRGHAAFVSIDLALVYVEQGLGAEAAALAAEILPKVESFQIQPEKIGALQDLHRAVRAF